MINIKIHKIKAMIDEILKITHYSSLVECLEDWNGKVVEMTTAY